MTIWQLAGRLVSAVLVAAALVAVPAPMARADSWTTTAPMPTARAAFGAATGLDGRVYAIGGDSPRGIGRGVEVYDPSANTWSTLAPMPTSRGVHAAAADANGRIYAIGGSDDHNNAVLLVEAYSPSTNTWTEVAPMHTARSSLAAATGRDGKIYAIGGFNYTLGELATVEVYDPATNTWRTVKPMPTGRSALAATTGADGWIYAIGGQGLSSGEDIVEAYDPVVDTWHELAHLSTGRHDLGVATGSDGRIYAFGGATRSNDPTNLVEAYDRSTNRWTSVAALPAPRTALAGVASQGRIYALGGHTEFLGPPVSSVDVYEPLAGIWSILAPKMTGRKDLAAATGADGRIYAIGGVGRGALAVGPLRIVETYDPLSNTVREVAPMPTLRSGLTAARGPNRWIYAIGGEFGDALGTVEAYDPATDAWIGVDALHVPRTHLAAATDRDGRMYAIGGYGESGYSSTVERYDEVFPGPGYTWVDAPPMPTPRGSLAATTGLDGKIYALGGQNADGVLSTAEVYDSASHSWTALPSMPTPRWGLAAAAGPDGQIYAIGGQDATGTPLTTVEAYDPSTRAWRTVAPLHFARFSPAAATDSGGRLYVLAGVLSTSTSVTYLNTIESYSSAFGPTQVNTTWRRLAPMPTGREGLAAVAGPSALGLDGIYAIGGFHDSDGGALATVEAYMPSTDNWKSISHPAPTPRAFLGATIVNNRIYAIGGSTGQLTGVDDPTEGAELTQVDADLASCFSGCLESGEYTLTYVWRYNGGTTGPAPMSSISIGSNQVIAVSLPEFPPGVESTDMCLGTSSDPDAFRWASNTTNRQLVLRTTPGPSAAPLPTRNTTSGYLDTMEAFWIDPPVTRLAASVSVDDPHLWVSSLAGFPAPPFRIQVDDEQMDVISVDVHHDIYLPGGDIFIFFVTHGVNSITAAHAQGRAVRFLTELTSAGRPTPGPNPGFTPPAGWTSSTWDGLAVRRMLTPRYGLAAVTAQGRIYAIGGGDAGGPLASLEYFDFVTHRWTAGADMPTPRVLLAAVVGSDGKIYTVGGSNGTQALGTLEVYDPVMDTWTALAPMPTPRQGLAAALGPGGTIYALGGADNAGIRLATVEAYDPATNSWTTVAPLPEGRRALAAASDSSGIYAIGGQAAAPPFTRVEGLTP